MQLNEQRIAVRSERKDLPKRRAEYRLELDALTRLAAEIGWKYKEPNELIERVPPRSNVELVRDLLRRHGELEAELRSARKALEESQVRLQDRTERLEQIGAAIDVSGLAAVLNVVRGIGDVAGRLGVIQAQVAEISGALEKKVRSLNPALSAGTDIGALAVPPSDTVIGHRDEVRDWARRQGETKQRLTEARNNLERDQRALAQRAREEGVVVPGAVEEARGYRDTLWKLVKARYIARLEITAEKAQAHAEALEDLPASLEGAVELADSVADRRFDTAQAAGELAVLARNIAGHETRIGQLEADEAALKAERERLDRAWHALWAEVPIEVLAPDAMLAWLKAREDIVTLIGREGEVQHQLDDRRQEEQEATAQVHAALTKLGWDAEEIKEDTLRVVIERADTYRWEQDAKAEKIGSMREEVRAAKAEVARRQRALDKAEAERESWKAEWAKAVAAIDLQGDGKPQALSVQVNLIDEMREHAATARDLRDKRISTIERDIRIFEQAVVEIVAELAPDLAGSDADASVVELDRRREEAITLHQQHQELTKTVTERQKKIEKLEGDRKAGWAHVQPLLEAASVGVVRELREVIKRSDRSRTLNEKLAGVMETLDQQGDGLAIEVLEEECRDVDIDEAQVRKEAAEAKLKVLGKQMEVAVVAWTEARKAFEAIGGRRCGS